MSVLTTVTRRLTAGVVLAGSAAALSGVAPASADTPSPDAALAWLADELDAAEGRFGDESFWQYGITIDAILALTLADAHDDSADAAMAVVEDNIESYVTDADFGDGEERYSGPLGKALLVAELRDEDTSDFGGLDLEAEVRARLQASGDDAGRFSDLSGFGDFSNGFGQALNILALSHTEDGVPASALAFLLAQQCDNGGFRGTYDEPGGCTDDGAADADYTAFALQALLTSPTVDGVGPAIVEAIEFLLAQQEDDGGYLNQDGLANATTAGLAANALRATGEVESADRSADFVADLQLTATDGPSAPDAGAIALSEESFDGAVADGITPLARDQFRRNTAQAVLGFGLPIYADVPPATVSSSATEGIPGSEVTLQVSGFRSGETVAFVLQSDPVSLGGAAATATGTASLTTTIPADATPGAHTITAIGQDSGFTASIPFQVLEGPTTTSSSTSSTAPGASTTAPGASTTVAGGKLPKTGSDGALDLVFAGLLLIGVGLVAREQRSRRSA